MYRQDSFFDLTPWGQAGLASISVAMFAVLILGAWIVLRTRPVWVRPIGSLVLFWLFVWLSPQIYYQYYQLVIPDLPTQWVIKPPIGPRTLFELLFFKGSNNLSAHGKGVLGWCLLMVPFLTKRTAIGN